MPQVDTRTKWFLLDSAHADYAAIIADLSAFATAHAETYSNVSGAVAGTKVVRSYMTEAERVASSPSLAIGGCVLDEADYWPCYSTNAASLSVTTSSYGDPVPHWGQFLKDVTAIPTTSVDRKVQEWIDGVEDVLYVGQAAAGTGDGLSRRNRRAIHDICAMTPANAAVNPTGFSMIVGVGRCSRFSNQGAQGSLGDGSRFGQKTGSSGTRTIILSDSDVPCELMGAPKLAGGTEDANWTNDGGGRWHIHSTSAAGGGGAFEFDSFVMSDDGGTLRALTKVASPAAVTALADSFVITGSSGSWDIYVRLASGNNPKDTTYVGPYVAGGISTAPLAQYVDFVGISFYHCPWYPAASGSHHRAYNCYWGYYPDKMISVRSMLPDEATGAMSALTTCTDSNYYGCEVEFAAAAFYNAGGASEILGDFLTVKDTYIHNIGLALANTFGVVCALVGDSHCVATFGGARDWVLDNIRCDNVSAEPIVLYIDTNNFTAPTGGLEFTDGYTIGWPAAKCYTVPSSGDRKYVAPCKNIYGTHIWTTNVLATGSGMGISLNGDTDVYGGPSEQVKNIKFEYCRLEGGFVDGAIRIKHMVKIGTTSHREIEFSHITVRGAAVAIQVFSACEDENGNPVEASCYIHDCDIHAVSGPFVYSINILNPTRRKREFQDNKYRTNGSGYFALSGGATGNFAWWQANAPGNDIHDPTGSTGTIPTSSGVGTITINDTTPQVGQTLTATHQADDPDGAASNHSYQWFADNELIAGATAATFSVTSAQLGKALKVSDLYQAAGAFKLIFSAATSNVASGSAGTFRASVFAAGVLA